MRVYDLTAPLCLEGDEIKIPKPKSAEISLELIGHDLLLSGTKLFKYLSNSIRFELHLGTHMDLPSTFAYQTVDPTNMPIDFFIREALIIHAERDYSKKSLTLDEVRNKINLGEFAELSRERRPALLFKTGMSKYWCRDNQKYMSFPGLSKSLIEFIAYELEPPFIGIDAISIDRTIEHRSLSLYTNIDEEFINILRMQEYTALLGHDILLRKNIYILENLDMNDIPQDVNRGLLIALPLFRFTSLTEKKTLITALPCRVIFLPEPEGSIEEVIKKLRALEKELSEIVK
ncbi:MAG: cyclase family protein [Zestosphaera sp.]